MGRPKKNQVEESTDLQKALLLARSARDGVLRSIRNLDSLANEAKTDVDKQHVFLARVISLEKYISQFEKYQQEILASLVDLNLVREFEQVDALVADAMEEMCGTIRSTMEQLQPKRTPNDEFRSLNSGGVPQAYHTVSLPKIELPKFDGNVIEWCTFRDMFQSLIHNNKAISDIERYHYLISCLSGPALTIVKAVPLSADNYSIAWNELTKCYENRRLLATAHVDKLFAFAPLKKESVSSLLSFVHTFRENVSAINALGIENISSFLLFYIGVRVIDTETRRLFEASIPQSEIPSLDDLLNFISQRCKILENIGKSAEKVELVSKPNFKKGKGAPSVKSSLTSTTNNSRPSQKTSKCLYCQHEHHLYRCFLFKKISTDLRRKFASDNCLCFCCLKTGHSANACSSTFRCKTCQSKHHTLLHLDCDNLSLKEINQERGDKSQPNNVDSEPSASLSKFAGTTCTDKTVVLGTAIVRIFDNTGELQTVRVLLDGGSQVSVMTSECVNRLGLQRHKTCTNVSGLSQQPVTKIKGSTHCRFVPLTAKEPQFVASDIIVLSQITRHMPSEKLPASVRERYRHLILADPAFDVPGPIDMLIGNDLYPLVLPTKTDVIHSPGLPSAMSTTLGWVIGGALNKSTMSPVVSLSITESPSIEGLLQQFWKVEQPPIPDLPTTEDELVEEWFRKTVNRDSTGRFCVALPFRSRIMDNLANRTPIVLGPSRTMALNRLYNLERRLTKDPDLYSAYRKFMNDYLSLGHMRPAINPGKYFIPHHPVVKRSNDNIKIRVVFDASARSSTGYSLNDCLATGPKLQLDISNVLLRSRFHKYLFIADIEKMYRQINICEEDCAYQHILWRNSPDEEVQEFQLCIVTYGMSSAPFLAMRCLHQLNEEDGPSYPLAFNILTTSTYVDDIVAGANTVEDVLQLKQEIVALLRRGNFNLKKWASNCTEVLENIDVEDRALDSIIEAKDVHSVKVLGLHWDTNVDAFGYHTSPENPVVTKRSILSTIARLYDPIGVLGPTIFWAKCVLQELWIQKLNWDEPPSISVIDKWKMFINDLPLLSDLSLPRHIDVRQVKSVQLLGFADASQKGYAAVVYVRIVDAQEVVRIHFITCKSKVAPLKSSDADITLTIPRLELCAALLLSQLLSHQLEVLQHVVNIERVRAWTDSTIVLAWLTTEQKKLKIFVTNRVAKIRSLIPMCEWAHVTSGDNPADPASRGTLPKELVSQSLHIHGPYFLHLPEHQWPVISLSKLKLPATDQLPEVKKFSECTLHVHQVENPEDMLKRFSSLTRMQRVLSHCYRFIQKARRKFTTDGPISCHEAENILNKCVKFTQNSHWPQLSKQLMNPQATITPSSLAQLAPFLDPNGIIRVGGRLKFSTLDESAKHPVLLPKNSVLTRLIILHYHQCLLHGGMRLVMSMIHRKFWIISCRSAIKEVIHSCVTCIRYRAACPKPYMANLPSIRVKPDYPFTNVGMDYGGPFVVKEARRRNSRTQKAYIALFVCMSVKAIHVEVVTDLSTETFLAAFDRFIARRGVPTEIRSDCGTNYVGAAREFKNLFKDSATRDAVQSRALCQWKFNPPAAPHFGGIWEAAIKSVKTHLKKVIGSQVFTVEEFTTLAIRIEGILNSRPLTPISGDPNDLNALTPGHFLIGRPISAIPERELTMTPMNRLNRWQLIKQAQQSFWKRWSQEYLQTLQTRQKWTSPSPSLAVGDLVVINSPNRPSMSWQLGRILQTHPGADDVVRVVTVRTGDGILKRPVVKLVKLPIS
ncbi:uncharacterized protein LOC126549771 [Aphis gossypii]|uniref:uncharacterized protein LOC126549771 n=1 Tax=Aphis gossypii TaxID=80765 RepID=UPI002159B3D5|nr:uncharacterized protein LOC126549771 [Aphis gossypii]